VPSPPRVPAADADRERIVSLLREHYALGQLDAGEFDRRTGIALSAQFADEAAGALDGLPSLIPPGPARRSRRRGHQQAARPGAAWVATAERFRDPASGVIMRVWIDPADQTRHYVPEAES